MSKPNNRRRRQWVLLTVGAAAVATLIISIVGIAHYNTGPVDLRGNRVTYDDAAPPTDRSSAVPQIGKGRFEVPSVGLNVPLGALTSVDNVIEPPGFTSAYWVRDHGVTPQNAGKGTVFVVMHSLRNGAIGPGNYLIDVDRHTSKVGLGATITVDDTQYTVTDTLAIDKPAIADANAVWANTPNRLVVITCLQRPGGGPSKQNIVIEAIEKKTK
ncbi:class F sortase [Curtobacterium flaccumfaciens pv. oortii]|uniref:class F sortase n=1 Tax=Curtobacterium flaccumfaciens TaxID=2035 RepID=UPI002659B9C9|nr:class F sortase [Curtobacterium flaccumfaciens]MCS5524676.1 class F sortase [Curtobacterium flaccumfaciens pv. oortii]